jgi:cell division septation protein DedD
VNTRYRDEIEDEQATGEREITLNAATILGIFFLLALICAVFFGFGYTLGRKSAPSPAAETLATPAPAPVAVASTPKPAPGSRTPEFVTPSATTNTESPSEAQKPPSGQIPQPIETPTTTASTTPQQVTIPLARPANSPARPPASLAPAAAPATHPAATAAAPVFMVQIAAVSHQEDAEVLRTALERRSYNITIVRVPQDKLLHVQVGPFTNRKDADAMRQRLLNDGYNAIVK